MKNRFLLAGLFAVSALMTACSGDDKSDILAVPGTLPSAEQPSADSKVQITFHGTADADNSVSKTVIAEGAAANSKKVNFVSGDQISVFDGTNWNLFTTTDEGESADFTGEALPADTYFMVYPAADGYSMTDGKIAAAIPARQLAVSGSFDPKANVSVAKCAGGEDFQLKNVCSLLRLVIPAGEEYDKIIVKSNDADSKIAGKVSVDPETGEATVIDGESEIELAPAAGGTIAEGEYYVALIPQKMADGITVELYDGSDVYAKLYKKELSFARSKGLNATMKDFDYINFDYNGVKFKMIGIPGYTGGFFYMAETETTQALWEAVTGENFFDSRTGKGDKYPANLVSWNDIRNDNGFLKKLNAAKGKSFRLPSSAEWVHAAEGGVSGATYSGCNSEDDLGDYAWYYGSIGSPSHCLEVATKKANGYGLYDMSGNVCEWCEDSKSDAPTKHVYHGGCYASPADGCKISFTSAYDCSEWGSDLGFRMALSL